MATLNHYRDRPHWTIQVVCIACVIHRPSSGVGPQLIHNEPSIIVTSHARPSGRRLKKLIGAPWQ